MAAAFFACRQMLLLFVFRRLGVFLLYHKHLCLMRGHGSFPALGFPGYVSVLPYIAHGVLAVESYGCKVEAYALDFVRGV